MAETLDFGRAVFTIEGENRQFISTLNQSEAAATQSLGKMEGSLASVETQSINTTQALSILGPAITAVGGRASAVAGPLVGIGAALASVGKALLSPPLLLAVLAAGLVYAGYRYATFSGELKKANERLAEQEARLKAVREANVTLIRSIEKRIAILGGAKESDFYQGPLAIKALMVQEEQLIAAKARAAVELAADKVIASRIIGLTRELAVMRGQRTEADFIVNAMEKRLFLERESLKTAQAASKLREQEKRDRATAVLGGAVGSAADAMRFLRGQEAQGVAEATRRGFLEQAAQHLFRNVKLSQEMIEVLKRFGLAGFGGAAVAAPATPSAISPTFGLASVGAFAGGPRTPPPTIGTIQAQTMQQKVSRLVDQLQRLITPQGLKTLVKGMD